MGESYRILYTWNSTTKIEVKDLPCNADYSGSFSGNFYFYLQRLVDGVWTDCPNYYWAIRGFNSSGGINYGYNGSTKQAANSISASTVNSSNNRYFEVYFLTEAMTPAGNSTSAVTETTTRKIFMSSRISKVPAGDGGLSIAITPSTLVVNTDENGVTEAASQDFTFKVYKGKDEVPTAEYAVTHSSLPDSDWTWTGLYYNAFRIQCASEATFETPTAITVTVALSSGGSIQTSVLLVPNRKGADGASAIHLDLDNEMDSILYAGSSKVGDSVTSQATLYNGGAPIDSSVTFTKDSSSTATGTVTNAGLVTVTGLPNNSLRGVIVVKATYNQVDYFATFTIDKIVDKPKYEISVDKSAIVINTDTTSASQSLVVRIWKSEVNSSGGITRTNITSLGNDLKLFYQVGSNQPGTISYSSGSGTVSSITSSVSQVTIWLTDSTGSSSSKVTGLLDIETVPVAAVQNGKQGEKGDVARQPYEWGKWSDFIANNSNTFTANKYESPFFTKEEEVTSNNVKSIKETKWLWVGDDGEYVPPSATAGEGQKNATTPSSSSEDWEEMVTDFKYIINEATISNYAKFGSGIFDGDYAFSQYGRVDGQTEDVMRYQNFRPEFFKGAPYTLLGSNKNIGGSYPTATPYEFGRLFLEAGVTYTITFTIGASWSSYIHFCVRKGSSGVDVANFSGQGGSSGSVITKTILFNTASSSGEYSFQAYTTNTSYTLTFRSIKISADKAFRPNLYIDWLHGEIYAQLGRFVNVTVEGVMNNLIQEVTASNISNYGNWNNTNSKLELNPLKIGSLVRFTTSANIYLPCDYVSGGTHYSQFRYGLTLDELRQCVGKKIYVFPSADSIVLKYYCGDNGVQPYGMLVKEIEGNTEIPSQVNTSTTLVVNRERMSSLYSSDQSAKNKMVILECKMTIFNGYECIYWQVKYGTVLPTTDD